jgi:hypothetical protein
VSTVQVQMKKLNYASTFGGSPWSLLMSCWPK